MSKVDEYHLYAAECVRVAQHTTSASDRLFLLEMAERWRELANREAQNEKSEEPEK